MKKSDLKILFLMLLLAAAVPLSAADIMPKGMTTLVDNVVSVFTGKFVRGILICCLAGCAVAYGFNKDNEKMKRNIIAIGIAIGVLVAAATIVDAIWGAAGS